MRIPIRMAGVVLAGGLVWWSGCDSAPGPKTLDHRSPVVDELVYTPQHVELEDVPPGQIDDGEVQVMLDLSVAVRDPDSDVRTVTYLVKAPLEVDQTIASGELAAAGSDRYEATLTVGLPEGRFGTYTVTVFAVDADDQLSNQVQGGITFACSTCTQPVIESVEAIPEVVVPPTELTLIATVSDPDGLDNIARVEGRAPAGFTFEMFDDGASQGDEVAGDGRFTASFDVDQATPGVQTFTFQAFDHGGLASDEVTKDITIE